jgi:hypothetical protein
MPHSQRMGSPPSRRLPAFWLANLVNACQLRRPPARHRYPARKCGWRRLWSWLRAEKGGYAGYVGMKIVLAIGASVVLAIISVIVFILLLIPIGGLGVIAVLSGATAGLTWNVFTITLAVFAGFLLFATIMFALSFISVPAIVFFSAYSIYFLAALLWPQPGAAVTLASLPTAAPPWPPVPN